MSFNKNHPRVAVVGAGIGGLSFAIGLKNKLHFDNFLIYEKGPGLGGTWRDNIYPGCSSDVAAHWYSLSTSPNPNWTSYFPPQPEILEYWESIATKHSLHAHIVPYTQVIRAVWDATDSKYQITIRNLQTGEEYEENVEVLVTATGGLDVPNFPKDIEGVGDFSGPSFHSARWQKDVNLSGKRVGVIGNAASAVQLIPKISADSTVKVVNFCRTPNWFVSRPNFKYPAFVKWLFAHVPGLLLAYRSSVAFSYDTAYVIFHNKNRLIQLFARMVMTKVIKDSAPKEYLDKLIPKYPPGCRRIIVNSGYLESLKRPNVEPVWDSVVRVVPNGVLLSTGETIPLDVLIFATGFHAGALQLDVIGENSVSLSQYFSTQGGPTAYFGTTYPGFPNFFSILGPNIATGHASIIFSEECQVNYILQIIEPVLNGGAKSINLKSEACDRFNASIQKQLKDTVWEACSSWYHEGVGGKNVALWPGPLISYWWQTKTVKWEDYEARGTTHAWEKRLDRRSKTKRSILVLLAVIAIVASLHPASKRIIELALRSIVAKVKPLGQALPI